MEQTAITAAIEKIKTLSKYQNIHVSFGMEQAIEILKDALPNEMAQIKEAFTAGALVVYINDTSDPQDYFTSKYQTNDT